jgi:hypothetical protein
LKTIIFKLFIFPLLSSGWAWQQSAKPSQCLRDLPFGKCEFIHTLLCIKLGKIVQGFETAMRTVKLLKNNGKAKNGFT